VHILLTDRLTCPQCGPTFGLVLLADRLENRVVHEGRLGCPNCRDDYPIAGGFADLRAAPREALPAGLAGSPAGPIAGTLAADRVHQGEVDAATKLLALLGIVGGPGTLALVGQPARAARHVARALPEMYVAAIDADLAGWPDAERVSRLVSSPGLPFFSGALRGVVVDGCLGEEWIREAARVTAPRARVVLARPPEGGREWLEEAGLRVLASDPETIVAARS